MSTLIFNPESKIFEKYKVDSDVIFYNGKGWWIVEGNERVCKGKYALDSMERGDSSKPAREIINEIRKFGPVWSRWMAKGDQYELLYRDALFNIFEISRGLKAYGINIAIFNTGVTHHISTMIFEIACASSNVKQVFLYTNNLMLGRLLPLIQEKSIKDRRPLNVKFSEKNAASSIRRFIDNKLLGGTPECGGELPEKREESILVAILHLIIFEIKKLLRPLKRIFTGTELKDNVLNKFYDYRFSDYFRQLFQQRSSLSFYKMNVDKQILKSSRGHEECRLLIAAHFQPEATSFPEGWDCHNNVDIIFELKRLGYNGSILYKEHPATFMYTAEGINFTRVGMYRSRHYYEQLLRLGCVFIDSRLELSLNSDNRWYLPVTITGTIAIERSLAGLHTIVTGYPWYKGLPGTLPIADIESLTEIKDEWVTPDPNLAKQAFEFLNDMLSNKTMINTLGFGTGKPLTNSEDNNIFLSEFDALLNSIKEI